MSNTQTSIDDALSMFNKVQEQDQANTSNSGSNNNNDILKSYFTTNIPKGDSSATKYFRIIPMPNGRAFEVLHFHNIPVDGKWTKLFDPAQEGNEFYNGEVGESPLKDLRESLYKTGKEDDKTEAKKYWNKRFYVIKGFEVDVDGNIVDERPKFWRFPHNSKKDGVMDKIMSIVNREKRTTETPIWDIDNGMTLEIEIQLAEMSNKKGQYYPKVTSVYPTNRGPITTDNELLMKLKNDDKGALDVYKPKPIEYLRIIADGDVPVYSKEKKGFVGKNASESSESISMDDANDFEQHAQTTPPQPKVEEEPKISQPAKVDGGIDADGGIDEDDLPF